MVSLGRQQGMVRLYGGDPDLARVAEDQLIDAVRRVPPEPLVPPVCAKEALERVRRFLLIDREEVNVELVSHIFWRRHRTPSGSAPLRHCETGPGELIILCDIRLVANTEPLLHLALCLLEGQHEGQREAEHVQLCVYVTDRISHA